MSTTTSEIPQAPSPADETRSASTGDEQGFLRRYVWWFVALGVLVLSAVIVRTLGTRPGYDPYGWLIWGYQTLHLNLDLGGAPSWKPLTWVFTVPYSLFGHDALWLWMFTAVFVSLAGGIFAGRIAYRLTGPSPDRRYAPIAAGVFAGLAVLGIQDYMHYTLSVQSDPMIVTFCLAAIDCHLSGHPRWAFAFGVLASLGRPEAWPFLGLYSIWAWRSIPSMRWTIYAGLALIPLLWFGVPTITNNRPFVSGDLALLSPRELHQNKVIGVLNRFTALQYLPVQLLALFAIVMAAIRRNRTVLILAGGAVSWIVVEIAFALHGWPAVPRYLFEPAGVMIALAGVGVGWILKEAPRLQEVPRLRRRVPGWAGIAVVGLLVVSLVPGALARVRTEHKDLKHERARTVVIGRLTATVNQVGGYQHILACGEPVTTVRYVAMLAYLSKLNDGKVGHRPKFELRQTYPIVMFTPLHSGWKVYPWHTAANMRQSCANLNASLLYTRHHPDGVLVPN
jgi:hypothetical protein